MRFRGWRIVWLMRISSLLSWSLRVRVRSLSGFWVFVSVFIVLVRGLMVFFGSCGISWGLVCVVCFVLFFGF